MEDSIITIIAIFLAAILMFIFPLMSIADRNDDISQLAVQTQTVEFVDQIRETGEVSLDDYDKFVETISSPNTYDIEIEIRVLDENPGKKNAQTSRDKVGENMYYIEYEAQWLEPLIEQKRNNPDSNPTRLLKEGDIISVTVKNTNTTIAQMLKNFFYGLSGNKTYQIEAQHSGVVATDGKI